MSGISTVATQTMSSLEIAKLTEKNHADVMRDIRNILEQAGIDQSKFACVYLGANGQDRPCYNLPRRECDLIVSGYSVKYRLAIIDRWQELEAQTANPAFVIPKTLHEALRLAADLAEKNEALKAENTAKSAQIEADKPKVEFAMAVRNLEGSCLVREFAKVIGTGEKRLFKQLREDGYLMANNQPYQRYAELGLFVVVEGTPYTDSQGKSHPAFTTRITGKGQVALEKKYRRQPRNGLVLIQGGADA